MCSISETLDLEHIGVLLGMFAVIFATINVVGGYVVTNRMLRMFKSPKKQ